MRLPHADLALPAYQSAHAAGLDLLAAVPSTHRLTLRAPGERHRTVTTHRASALPPDIEGQVRPRSGLALSTASPCSTRLGTIDADYAARSSVILINHRAVCDPSRRHRISQLIVASVTRVTACGSVAVRRHKRGSGRIWLNWGRGVLLEYDVSWPDVSMYRNSCASYDCIIRLPRMPLLPRKGLLLAVPPSSTSRSTRSPPSIRKLAARHNLPPRHLEPVLQALVHGRHLPRHPRAARRLRACARAAADHRRRDPARRGTVEDEDVRRRTRASPGDEIVMPAVAHAGVRSLPRSAQLNLEDLTRRAEGLRDRRVKSLAGAHPGGTTRSRDDLPVKAGIRNPGAQSIRTIPDRPIPALDRSRSGPPAESPWGNVRL